METDKYCTHQFVLTSLKNDEGKIEIFWICRKCGSKKEAKPW